MKSHELRAALATGLALLALPVATVVGAHAQTTGTTPETALVLANSAPAPTNRGSTAAAPAAPPDSWPQWGGPNRDFHAPASELAPAWPESGPPTLWRRELGDGHSGLLFEGGRLYTMYRDGGDEVVICLDAATGATLWERRYRQPLAAHHMRQWGDGPNATPLVAGDRLFTVGRFGRMHALDKRDGAVLWSRDLWGQELGGRFRANGYSSSPVSWNDSVIVPVGAEDGGVMAFGQADGHVLWKSTGSKNSYSSPTILEVAGRPQLLSFMADELLAVDPGTGELLWRYAHGNQWGHNINVPVVASGDVVFFSSPQAGARGLRITRTDHHYEVEELWANRRVQFYHVTSVQEGDWVYGSSGTNSPAFMMAIDVQNGEVAWRERGFAKANTIAADGRLLILDEDGVLYLATATPSALVTLARAQILEPPAWTAPTIVGSTLYARNRDLVVALDLGSGARAAR